MAFLSPQVNVMNRDMGTSQQNHPEAKHINVYVFLVHWNNAVVYEFFDDGYNK